MALRAVIYARQSLDRSGEGAAVDRQVADCRALAEARDWTVVDTITDNDLSASSGVRRPGYERVLSAMRSRSIDVVVVWHLDRLARRMVDLEQVIELCEQTRVRVATVTGDLDLSNDVGQTLGRILAAVAAGEVKRKGARQRRANAQRAEAGHMGWTRRPFGYDRRHGVVVIVEDEAEGLRAAARMVLDGATLAAATRMLAGRGLATTAGKPWNVTTLRRVLLSPRYSGRVLYRGADVAEGVWPAILDAEAQDRLAAVLRDVKRRVQQGTEAKYLLSGLARCGRCGEVLYASPLTRAGGERWIAYRCRECYLTRRCDLVDEVVEGVVLGRLSRPDAASLIVEDEDTDALRKVADELRGRRDELAGLLADGLLSAAVVREKASALTIRLADVEDRIARAFDDSPAAGLLAAGDMAAHWQGMPVRERKAVVDLLMTVTIQPSGKGVRFDPEHVTITWKGKQ